MRSLILVMLCVLAPLVSVRAQVENRGPQAGLHIRDFSLEALCFRSADSTASRVDFYLQVPYDVLKFVATPSGFAARYEFTVNILNGDGNGIFEKSWNEEVRAKTFDETQATKGYSLTQRSITLAPGSYSLHVELHEAESGKISIQRRTLDVPDFKHSPFALSDIMLVNRVADSAGRTSISPNVTGNLYENPDNFYVFFEIYTAFQADSVALAYSILDTKDRRVYRKTENRRVEGAATQVIAKIDSSRFPFGTYELRVEARSIPSQSGGPSLTAEIHRSLVMRWGTLPLTMTDLDVAIRQTRYIAASREYDSMMTAPTLEQKQKLFQEFWRRRDPSPDTKRNEYMEEYYSRVQYSNEHFSHFMDGWKTDMGMVFIMLGSPNNVDRHPFNEDSKPYEIWYYYDYSAQVIFVDETGLSDYRLITPIWDLIHRVK